MTTTTARIRRITYLEMWESFLRNKMKNKKCTTLTSEYVPHWRQNMYHTIVRICTTLASEYVPHWRQNMYHTDVRICTTLASEYVPHHRQNMYHTGVRIFLKSNQKIVETGTKEIPRTNYFPLSYMKLSCKRFPHVGNMTNLTYL
jgi:hypothetical protein